MIGSPQPAVLHVEAGRRSGHMHGQVCCNALGVHWSRRRSHRWSGRALSYLEVRPSEATDTSVHIPHASWGARGGKVPLDQNGTLLLPLSADDHVAPLDRASLSGATNLDHRLGVVDVIEVLSPGQDD